MYHTPLSLALYCIDNNNWRWMCHNSTYFTYGVARGARYAVVRRKEYGDLTADVIKSGEWKTAPAGSFKAYNVDSPGPVLDGYFLI
jgi:hypothetical protein